MSGTNGAALAVRPNAVALEKVLLSGDLAALTADERLSYYKAVCESVGLNPLTQPFDYLKLSGKTVLYAKKGCAEQLRDIHGISIDKPDVQFAEGLVIASVTARDKGGRTDSDVGAVPIGDLKGEARANAIMKAITKAKRRTTLSLCGLGMLDESELDTIPDARPAKALPAAGPTTDDPAPLDLIHALNAVYQKNRGWKRYLTYHGVTHPRGWQEPRTDDDLAAMQEWLSAADARKLKAAWDATQAAARQAAAANIAPPAAHAVQSPPPAQGDADEGDIIDAHRPATAAQLDDLVIVRAELGLPTTTLGPRAAQKWGVGTTAELSELQAAELLAELRAVLDQRTAAAGA